MGKQNYNKIENISKVSELKYELVHM